MLCYTSLNLCCGLLQGFLKTYRSPQSSMFSPFGVHLLNRLNHLHDEQSRWRDVRVIWVTCWKLHKHCEMYCSRRKPTFSLHIRINIQTTRYWDDQWINKMQYFLHLYMLEKRTFVWEIFLNMSALTMCKFEAKERFLKHRTAYIYARLLVCGEGEEGLFSSERPS